MAYQGAELAAVLRQQRLQMAEAIPADVLAVRSRQDIMAPAGPLFYAEGESRKLHELLWKSQEIDIDRRPAFLFPVLDLAVERLEGWARLDRSVQPLRWAGAYFQAGADEQMDSVLAQLMLWTGRLSMWLDALIPWNDVNETIRAAELETEIPAVDLSDEQS